MHIVYAISGIAIAISLATKLIGSGIDDAGEGVNDAGTGLIKVAVAAGGLYYVYTQVKK